MCEKHSKKEKKEKHSKMKCKHNNVASPCQYRKECKHNNVVLIKTEDRTDDTLKHTYECDRCDRQTIYIYELKKCYDVKGKNEMEYKAVGDMDKVKVGDIVSSKGGFFSRGIVEKVDGDLITIRWTKDSRIEKPIDVIQIRTSKTLWITSHKIKPNGCDWENED